MPKPKSKKKSVKAKASGAKNPIAYAFIDSQNLNLGTSKNMYRNKKLVYKGWKMDYSRFLVYLQDKFRVNKAFLFIGYIKEYENMYKKLRSFGFEIVFKPTVKDLSGKPKGNVAAELVLQSAAIELENYDRAVVVSGDGDFYCLHKFLRDRGKLFKIIIPNEKATSSLLRGFEDCKVYLERDKNKLEMRHG